MGSVVFGDGENMTDAYVVVDHNFEPPHTPTSGSDDDQHGQFSHGGAQADSDEEVSRDGAGPRRKPGGYDSRIEQILYENPDQSILITEAGKSLESGGRYIVYTIRTGVGSRLFRSRALLLLTFTSRTWKCDVDIRNLPPCAMP